MIPREFGNTGIQLSPISFGSMRLEPKKIELKEAVQLLAYLYDNGINTFHSSHEYETDDFFCQALSQFRSLYPGAELLHITKLGVPHFDEANFQSDRLIALVEKRLRELNTERLDLVQWLVRHQPNEDLHRLPILADCQQELSETWLMLQREGKVGALASFPYSVPFAKEVLNLDVCKGLITYLNLLELEMTPLLGQMKSAGQSFVAIRPLVGGLIPKIKKLSMLGTEQTEDIIRLKAIMAELNVSDHDLTKLALQFPLLHPAIASTIISIGSIKHAEEVIAHVNHLKSDQFAFEKIVQTINNLSPEL